MMAFSHKRTIHNSSDRVLEQLKKNDEVFRNTMEDIFEKYSNLEDPGLDVCLRTMTFRTVKGSVPIDSEEAERELEQLRSRVRAGHMRVLEDSRHEQNLPDQEMDVTQRSENNPDHSSQMEDSMCHGTKPSQHTVNESHTSWWGETSQPEDQDLERTLSSHGSTLLDVYPSMLHQIGEAYRRQHVTNAAGAVLRKYRRKRWQSHQSLDCSRSFGNNETMTVNTRKLIGTSVNKNRTNGKASPTSSACFYSPKIKSSERSAETGPNWSCFQSKQSVRVLDLSTLPSPGSTSCASASPCSPSPDLNQTYQVEPVLMSGFGTCNLADSFEDSLDSLVDVPKNSSLSGHGRPVNSLLSQRCHMSLDQQYSSTSAERESFEDRRNLPVKVPKSLPLASHRRLGISSPSQRRHSSLGQQGSSVSAGRDSFEDRLEPLVEVPKSSPLLGYGRSDISLLSHRRRMSLDQQYSGISVECESFEDRLDSPVKVPKGLRLTNHRRLVNSSPSQKRHSSLGQQYNGTSAESERYEDQLDSHIKAPLAGHRRPVVISPPKNRHSSLGQQYSGTSAENERFEDRLNSPVKVPKSLPFSGHGRPASPLISQRRRMSLGQQNNSSSPECESFEDQLDSEVKVPKRPLANLGNPDVSSPSQRRHSSLGQQYSGTSAECERYEEQLDSQIKAPLPGHRRPVISSPSRSSHLSLGQQCRGTSVENESFGDCLDSPVKVSKHLSVVSHRRPVVSLPSQSHQSSLDQQYSDTSAENESFGDCLDSTTKNVSLLVHRRPSLLSQRRLMSLGQQNNGTSAESESFKDRLDSPVKVPKSLPLTSRGNPALASPSQSRHSSLGQQFRGTSVESESFDDQLDSPVKVPKSFSLSSHGRPVMSLLSQRRQLSLGQQYSATSEGRENFKDGLNSPVKVPHQKGHGSSVISASSQRHHSSLGQQYSSTSAGRESFDPGMDSPIKGPKSLPLAGHGRMIISPSQRRHSSVGQQYSSTSEARENLEDGLEPSDLFSPKIVVGCSATGRSPFKPRVLSLEEEPDQQTSSFLEYHRQQLLPVRSSPLHSCQENEARVRRGSLKLRRSLTLSQPGLRPLVSEKSSSQIDAEFRSLYHHFICRGSSSSSSSSCPDSSCQLCERRPETTSQRSTLSSSRMSALALTPLQSRLKKRRRQSEIVESLRFKRFRESCSPVKRAQFCSGSSPTTARFKSSEDKHTWNRSVLLQCPSPGFLQASGYVKKVPDYNPDRHIHRHSPSLRHPSSCAEQVSSPVRAWNQSGVSHSPSVSRRRLLYGPDH